MGHTAPPRLLLRTRVPRNRPGTSLCRPSGEGMDGPERQKPDCCHKGRNARRDSAANDETKMSCDDIRLKQARATVLSNTTVVHLPPRPRTTVLESPASPSGVFAFRGVIRGLWASPGTRR